MPLASPDDPSGGGPGRVLSTLTWQTLRDSRVRTAAFVYLFAVYAYVQPAGYRHTYPTVGDRRGFADSFAGNVGLRLLYGHPVAIQTTAGYTAWRVGGVLAIAAAVYGVLAAVRTFRTEEESGRSDVVLAGPVSRATVSAAGLLAIIAGMITLGLAEFAGLVFAGLPTIGSAYLALATLLVAGVGAGMGALASQLVSSRRAALGLGGVAVAVTFLLRILADTVDGAGWLRWTTPLGWAEQLQPFVDTQAWVLLLPAATTALLLAVALRLARIRDVGTGLIATDDSADARLWLLSSPSAMTLRNQRGVLGAWLVTVAIFMTILGAVSHSLSTADVPQNVQRQIAKLGSGSIVSPTGFLAFLFLFVTLAVCLFGCTQVNALRDDEIQHLDTLLAQPVSRTRWLGGRLAIATLAAAMIALIAGVAAWVGAAASGTHVALSSMLEAGANALPVAVLFLGLTAFGYAIAPRAAAGIGYGLVALAFLWQLVGALLGPPRWVLDLSPFAHVALVPAQPFQPVAGAVLLGVGVTAGVAALVAFTRRDIIEA
jgi:ABC-2 type transport system permease protein